MSIRLKKPSPAGTTYVAYQEVNAKQEILLMLVLVVLVTAPLIWLNVKIEKEGARSADVSNYDVIMKNIDQNARSVRQLRGVEVEALAALKYSGESGKTSLIVPNDGNTNSDDMAASRNLDIELSGIIWNPAAPLVIIDREIYKKGESVNGYEIIKVSRTEVTFRNSTGDIVVKQFYEYLETSK
jgi:hypothetical protein